MKSLEGIVLLLMRFGAQVTIAIIIHYVFLKIIIIHWCILKNQIGSRTLLMIRVKESILKTRIMILEDHGLTEILLIIQDGGQIYSLISRHPTEILLSILRMDGVGH